VATDQCTGLRLDEREALFDALGDGTRRAIVDLLAARPRAVVELAAELPVGRPAVSMHLKVLREAGLVADSAVGTKRVYRLDPDGLQRLRASIDGLWSNALDRFAAAAEAAHAQEQAKKKAGRTSKRSRGGTHA